MCSHNFFQLSERENKKLAQIVKALPFVQEFNKEVTLNDTFRLSKLLPDQEKMEHFYTYQGSLTTPPCSEAVTWILFPDPLPVSLAQVIFKIVRILLMFTFTSEMKDREATIKLKCSY